MLDVLFVYDGVVIVVVVFAPVVVFVVNLSVDVVGVTVADVVTVAVVDISLTKAISTTAKISAIHLLFSLILISKILCYAIFCRMK